MLGALVPNVETLLLSHVRDKGLDRFRGYSLGFDPLQVNEPNFADRAWAGLWMGINEVVISADLHLFGLPLFTFGDLLVHCDEQSL